MTAPLNASAQRVQDALTARGYELQVIELPASTRSAAEAAQAIGCAVAQICKSLVFLAASGRPILIVASGANRVNEERVAALLGEPIHKADADFVREHTGFAIGGVPPVGHTETLETLIDPALLQYDVVWAAAGTSHAVFSLTPAALVEMTGGRVAPIT